MRTLTAASTRILRAYLGGGARKGVLLSYGRPTATVNLRPDATTYVLGPKGTYVGVSRGKEKVTLGQRFAPPIALFFEKTLPIGGSVEIKELRFSRPSPAKVLVEVDTRNAPPAFEKPAIGDINPRNYEVLTDVSELRHGDILAGASFNLGNPRTYGTGDEVADLVRREILILNLSASSHVAGLLALAKTFGPATSFESVEARLRLSNFFYDLVFMFVADGRPAQGLSGQVASMGECTAVAAHCRHRSALRSAMGQRADYFIQYVRGTITPYGCSHAWNKDDILGNRSLAYFVDSSLGVRGRLDGEQKLKDVYLSGNPNALTRGDLHDNFTPDRAVNTVWRRRP